MRLKNIFSTLVVSAVLSGCASNVVSVQESYNKIRVDVAGGSEGRQYVLRNSSGQSMSSASLQGGILSFDLGNQGLQSDCYAVYFEDEALKGESGSYSGFRNGASAQYQQHLEKFNNANSNIAELRHVYNQAVEQLSLTASRLADNRAERDGTCSVPNRKPLPQKPNFRCNSANECVSDANQICYAMAFGAEGCSVALSQKNIPGVIAGPACGAAAANLVSEKYDGNALMLDAIRGVVDDWADQRLRDGGFWNTAFGVGAKALNYASKAASAEQCVDGFVKTTVGALRDWEETLELNELEPVMAYTSCEEDLEQQASLKRIIADSESQIQDNEFILHISGLEIEKIKMQRDFGSMSCNI